MLHRRHARNVSVHRFGPPSPELPWVAGGLVAAVLAIAGCGGDDAPSPTELADRRERQAVAAAADAGLAEELGAVLGTAARAPAASFSTTYRAGADRIVVYQRPPRRRVDVLAGGVVREAVVSDAGGEVRCERPEGRAWACATVPDGEEAGGGGDFGAFSPELVARTVEALEDARPDFALDVVARDIAGVEASCIRSRPVTDHGAAPAWLCVAPDGVPLLVDRGDGSPELRAVAYRRGASAEDVARPDR